MRKSIYNIVQAFPDGVAVYNSYSGALVNLDKHHQKMFEDGSSWQDNPSFIDEMKRGGFIVDDELDELERVVRLSSAVRKNPTSAAFTIAPTTSCNFRCPYCYEEGCRTRTMTTECADAVVQYINYKMQAGGRRDLQVTWYGGEPLLAVKAIERITDGIRIEGINYTASMVTNGYYLDGAMARRLKELDVRHVQITVDGPPEIHNKRRRLPSGKDTFFRILDNIAAACNEIRVIVRVNVDLENAEQIDGLLGYFDRCDLRGKVAVYLAPVSNINGCCPNNTCLSSADYALMEAEFLKRNLGKGYLSPWLPGFNPAICGAVNECSSVIDPEGNLYKCWNEIGHTRLSYGSVFQDLVDANIDKWIQYQIPHFKECRACELLPVCMGGCPFDALTTGCKRCLSLRENVNERIGLARLAWEKRNVAAVKDGGNQS